MNDRLQSVLKQLRLSGLALALDVRVQEATGHQLSHTEFLELILQDELHVREQRLIARRVKAAAFKELKPLDEFDGAFHPSIPRKQVFDLAACRFIRETRDVLLIGPPGVGKSFVAQAVGYQAIKQGFVVLDRSIFDVVRDFLHDEALGGEEQVLLKYLKPDLLIVDDMGMKNLPKRSGEFLFEIILRRYETRSTMIDVEPPAGGLGQTHRRRPQRHGDPRPLPAPRRHPHDERPQLPSAESRPRPFDDGRNIEAGTKTGHSARRLGTDNHRPQPPHEQAGGHRFNLRFAGIVMKMKPPFTPAALSSPPQWLVLNRPVTP